jgi:hypothetical protein
VSGWTGSSGTGEGMKLMGGAHMSVAREREGSTRWKVHLQEKAYSSECAMGTWADWAE